MQRSEDDKYLGDSPRLVGFLILVSFIALIAILIIVGLIVSRG